MSEEKVVKIDVNVAKKKISDAKTKAISTTSEKLKTAKLSLAEKIAARKEKTIALVLDKSLELTKKQLKALEGFKKKQAK